MQQRNCFVPSGFRRLISTVRLCSAADLHWKLAILRLFVCDKIVATIGFLRICRVNNGRFKSG
jgi:hypothetical protein